ncbi:MAG TPA: hypothetical protein VGB14_16980 [Acidimicrobiales bacterium]
MSRRWRALALAGALAIGGVGGVGCGGDDGGNAGAGAAEPAPARRVLIVSGRDDHGLLAEPAVALVTAPDATAPTGSVPDGTLVEVVATRGEWAKVRALEGAPAEGWVNDFYLRGTAHVACTNEQVELLAVDDDRVQVRPAAGGPSEWVDRDAVSELPTEC